MRKPQREKQITVIIKRPGRAAEVELLFENTLQAFQEAVGGYIETVTIASDAVLICNGEGRLLDLPHNCNFAGMDFVGTLLIAGVRGEEFASLSMPATKLLLRTLNKQ